ncbi:hypothetical protein GMORB2_4638 [Geosmithia morbida]|uniref:N-acetyltransferase domain-containing protein n=1 Tax=Geosmithia morbida TaxID=1094350 RepID=A0A9P5CXP3_9HYPO|nr:uncharacterized protein GMORB2_4638 [Geosmithia morbida]KAF4119508.1 hypothetical protein GMORB2_4638 [Geosmithia morbida]
MINLPAVVKVILAAINKERLWTNFVPSKSGQDQAYLDEIESLLRKHLDPSNKDWVIEVIDLGGDGSKRPSKIVSVAIWDMSASKEGDKKEDQVKTAVSDSRLNAYAEVVDKARREFFNRYQTYTYLQLLATHPDYQNKGYAKDLVHSYITRARQQVGGDVLTALGGPFGYIFFSGINFNDLGPVSLPPSSASDAQIIKAMSLVVPKEERKRSIVDSVINYISS